MTFKEFGDPLRPHIMLIHGGGNAWWSFLRQAQALSSDYHVILPTLDGHGEEFSADYLGTEDSAEKLSAFVDSHCKSSLHALCGVSLGGQIVIEMLSRRPEIAKKAIVDGSLCYPHPLMAICCITTITLLGKFIFSEKACAHSLKLMPRLLPEKMLLPSEIQQHYMRDMPRIKTSTLSSIYKTYMMKYRLKDSLRLCRAETMYWYGEREMAAVKRSAKHFQKLVPSCRIYEAMGYNHGYLAIYLPEEWLELATDFFNH